MGMPPAIAGWDALSKQAGMASTAVLKPLPSSFRFRNPCQWAAKRTHRTALAASDIVDARPACVSGFTKRTSNFRLNAFTHGYLCDAA